MAQDEAKSVKKMQKGFEILAKLLFFLLYQPRPRPKNENYEKSQMEFVWITKLNNLAKIEVLQDWDSKSEQGPK